ncbi:CBD9-like protein [Alternaria alternata]|uniref:CBD9-like protein n=1 Tax=Alternaria alternata TaxID=5599 RepID=A0A177DEB8_ALTAL|nr:CBD9-like protein [Alternaria alternata]OAG17159.1 CBD9-like protein [Alternaria alternata]
MKRLNLFITSLFAVINVCRASDPVQTCHIDSGLYSDACMAIKTVKSQHTRGHDLLMTFSVKFHQRNGWAAFGVGEIMDRALMFVLWPGEQEGDTVLSLRSTVGHYAPHPLKNQRQVHVHRTEVDENGFHVLQATCYSCETVGLGPLNATSEQQPWLFASSSIQKTRTNDPNLRMDMHTDYGLNFLNMAHAISTNQAEEYPIITGDRSSTHALGSSELHTPVIRSSINMWDAHGAILSFAVVLNCIGILLIRSGLKWAFRGHWLVQALSASGLLAGCLIGVMKSTHLFQIGSFTSIHKMIGLAIAVAVPVQITFGYKHHMNYVKYGERTRSSLVHVYLGRALFLALNLNVFLGLSHGRKSITLRWLWAMVVSIEMLAVGTMMFAKRTDNKKGYGHVEGEEFDPFVIGDEEEKLRDPESFEEGSSKGSIAS